MEKFLYQTLVEVLQQIHFFLVSKVTLDVNLNPADFYQPNLSSRRTAKYHTSNLEAKDYNQPIELETTNCYKSTP